MNKLFAVAFLFFSSTPFFESLAGVTDNWFPLPTANSQFLLRHPNYARMLWAFDYGHALIYEALWRNAQTGDYDFCYIEGTCDEPPPNPIVNQVMKILKNPPQQAPSEETLSPFFTMDFSWVMDMFSWSHKLHWVTYDVIAGETLDRAKAIMREQIKVYQHYPSLALPTQCKSMMYFMEGQPYGSMKFRTNAPIANGLIWAYHYYQLALYDALIIPPGPEREKELANVMKTFNWMIENPVDHVPVMPMAKKVSPKFYKHFPELAAIFDNLHEYHDVVGDVLSLTDDIYGSPKQKKIEMDRTMREMLDGVTKIVDCDKNGHEGA